MDAIDVKARSATAERSRQRLRRGLLAGIGLLYLLSVPWYWTADASPQLWFGLPSWVAVAVGCYFAAACLNAIAWWIAPLSDDLPVSPEDESSP